MAFPTRILSAGFGLIAVAVVALGADEPKQTINAEGITFQAPRAWKSTRPGAGERFRKAYLKVEPAEGDADPAELVVTSIPGDGGGVEANVARWQGMFKSDEDGRPVKATVKAGRAKNAEVTTVDVAGHYVAAVRPGSPQRLDKPHYRLLGAIVPGKEGTYFLKMTGPEKTMTAARPAFDELLASIHVVEP